MKAQGIVCSNLMIMSMKAGVIVKILNSGLHLGTVQSDAGAGLEVHLSQDWGGPRLPAKVGGAGGVGGPAIYQPVQNLTALGQPRERGRQVILASHLADFSHLL